MFAMCGAALAPALALAAPPARHPLTLDDIMATTAVRGLACSADGRSAAWVATTNDVKADKRRSRIWTVDLSGGAPRALTAADQSASAPAFSPDGSAIAFLATRGKDEHDQIWLLDRRGGEAQKLSDVTGDIDGFRWSPDGKRIVLMMTDPEPKGPEDDPDRPLPQVIDTLHFKQDTVGFLTAGRHTHLWLLDVATHALTRLTAPGEWDESAAEWSPDGRTIAFVADHATDPAAPATQWLLTVRAEAGAAPHVVAHFPTVFGQGLVWSRDGQRIVHVVGLDPPRINQYSQPQLAQTDLASGKTRIIPAAAGMALSDPIALGQDRIGAILAEDRREIAVALDPAGGALQRLGDPALAVSEQCGATDGGKAPRAIIASGDGRLSEVLALNGARATPLSAHNATISAQVAWAPVIDFAARADDGNEVHGMLIQPAGYRVGQRYPTVLLIHGGPTSQDTHDLDASGGMMVRQWLSAHGYAVLAVNYRGSSGRGMDYASTIAADWGNKEVRDLDAAVDWAIARGIADPARLGVGGWSYGGILTDFLIAREPRFKAAISGAGEGNILALFGVDQYIAQYWQEIGPPWQNPALWQRLSEALLHADRIRTPTLFMGGSADDNVPLIGGQQLYAALKLTGVPTRLVVYPGAFHGLTRPGFVRDRYERFADWYGKWLAEPAKP